MAEFGFVTLLKACAKKKDIKEGLTLHADILKQGLLERSPHLASSLITMYAKCGDLQKAYHVFEDFTNRDLFSWNALISGYSQQGQGHSALYLLERMKNEGISPDAVTFISSLKACSGLGAISKGKQIHNSIVSTGLLKSDVILGTALVDMYAKCGLFAKALQVLEELPVRDSISWSSLISGYAQLGRGHEALCCFEQMKREGLSADVVTFICILQACGSTEAAEQGRQVHDEIVCRGILEKNIILGNALVDMYAKCGILEAALLVLQMLPTRDVISWNTVIAGYVQRGQCEKALDCLERMQSEGIFPDAVTYVCIVNACGNIGNIRKGKQIHEDIINGCILKNNLDVGNALVDMYAKCEMIATAQEVLEELPERDIVSWNSLIAGYAQLGQCSDAISCVERMQIEGFSPNSITFVSVLKACGRLGAIEEAKRVHDEIVVRGLFAKEILYGNALVDVYARCGMLGKAKEVLEKIPFRDTVSWSALIAGYARQRQGHEALSCFHQMRNEGFSPDAVTFICILNACCHTGLLEEAQTLFSNMTAEYGIIPTVEHYTSMVAAFGNAGFCDNALSLLSMASASSSLGDPGMWLPLLGSCRTWGNVKLGKLAFDQVLKCDSNCATAYRLMIDIFIAADLQEDAEWVEDLAHHQMTGNQKSLSRKRKKTLGP